MSAEFAKSTFLSAIANIAMIAGGFFTTVIVARMLGPEAVGILAYAAFVVTLSLAILDMGVPGTLMRFLSELAADGRENEIGGLVRFLFVPYAVAALIFSAGLFLLLDPRAFLGAEAGASGPIAVALVAGAVLAQALAVFQYGALKGQRRFLLFATITAISALMQLAVAWVGSMIFGVMGALAAPVAGFLIGAIVAVRSLAFRGQAGTDLKRRAVTYAWRIWGTYFLTTIAWSRMEIFFIKHSWGDHAAGLFAAGLNLANLALQLPILLTGALIPFLVLKSKSDSPEQFAQSYAGAVRLFAMLVFPACFGAAAITPALLPLIFGSAFGEAILPAMIVIAGSVSMTFVNIVQNYSFAVEKTAMVLRLAALGAVLSVISGLTLTPLYGTIGAAVGRAAAQGIVAAGMIAYAHHLGWRTPFPAILRIVAAALLTALIAAVIARLVPHPAGVAVAIFAAMLAYVIFIKYFRILSEAEHRLIDRLISAPSLPPPVRSSFAWTAAWLRR